ncbi:MAG: hypothetical protein AB7O97_18960 [Planctomycetota bacterium]
MMLRTRSVLALAAAAAFATACGSEPVDQTAAWRQLEALMPADALVIARLPALDRVHDELRHYAEAGDLDYRRDDLDRTLRKLPGVGDIDLVSRRHPIGVALRVVGGIAPAPVAIVPCDDPAAYVATLPPETRDSAVVAGDYVAVPMGPGYRKPESAPALAQSLPDAPLVVRADVAQLAKVFRGPIQAGLNQMERLMKREAALTSEQEDVNLDAIAQLYLSGVQTVLECATTLELSCDSRAGVLDVATRVSVAPDSDMDGWSHPHGADLTELARRLDPDADVSLLMAMDYATLRPRIEPMLEELLTIYPEEARVLMRDMLPSYDKLYRHLAGGSAINIRFGDGARVDTWSRCEDPRAMVRESVAALQEMPIQRMGVEIVEQQQSESGGHLIQDLGTRLDWDRLLNTMSHPGAKAQMSTAAAAFERLLGGDVMRTRMVALPDGVAMRIGGDAAYREATASLGEPATAAPPGILAPALARLKDAGPIVIEALDFAQMTRAIAELAPPSVPRPALRADARAPAVVYGGIAGRDWLAGITVDLAGIMTLSR